jgi:hypothetical protein
VAGFLTPGSLFFERTSGLNMVESNRVLNEYAVLTHISTVLAIFGFGLILFGLIKLWPVTRSMDAKFRFITQLGIAFLAVFFLSRLFQRGVYHVVVHVSEHGIGGATREQAVALMALGAQTTGLIFRYVGGTLGLVGLALFPWGVSTLFEKGFWKAASVVMAVYSVFGFVGLMLAEHVHGFDYGLLGNIYTSLRILVSLWLIVLGVAIYKGKMQTSPA